MKALFEPAVRFVAASIMSLPFALCPDATAAVVFEQPPDPNIFAGSSSPLDFFGRQPGRNTADDFTLTDEAVIRRVDFWGQHAAPSSGEDDFVLTFYENDNGLPGTPLLETRGAFNAFADPLISNLSGYELVLDTPFVALPDTRYWLSVFNAPDDAAWRWNNSQVGNNDSVQIVLEDGAVWRTVSGSNTDLSFRLSTVPEPAAAALVTVTLLAYRRRRRT